MSEFTKDAIGLLRCASINCDNVKKMGSKMADFVKVQIDEAIQKLIESGGGQPAPLAVDEGDWPAGTFAKPAPPQPKEPICVWYRRYLDNCPLRSGNCPEEPASPEEIKERGLAVCKDYLISAPPAKEGVSVSREKARLAFRTFWGRLFAEEPGKNEWEWFWPMLRSLGIRVVEPSEAAEGEPEGGGE